MMVPTLRWSYRWLEAAVVLKYRLRMMSVKLCRWGPQSFPSNPIKYQALRRSLLLAFAVLLAQCESGFADSDPAITQQPQGKSVLEGSNFTFSVTATGTAPLNYRWRFNGTNIANATNSQLAFAPVALTNAGSYTVVVSNSVGSVTSTVAQLVVRSTNDPVYATPDGGWSYIYTGSAIASSQTAGLDGTWNRVNGDDAWSGDGRGAGNGLPGGISTSNGVMTIEDAVSPGGSGLDNRRYYFTHNINADAAVTNANTLINDGVTLSFRARLTPASDPLIEITNAPNGFVNVNDGKGMFGIRQAGSSGMIISFSLNKAVEDTSTTANFTNSSAGLHMNNLNGDVRSAAVDPGEGGTTNLLALDPAVFHEFWIQIQDNGASPGTHRVSIYLDGSATPTVFNVTAGSGVDTPSTNYLALGLPSSAQRGAVDVDFFSYKAGIIAPVGQEAPPGFVLQPVSQMLAEAQTASFTVGVTGTPPFQYQWYKRGVAIANATNSSYTTPPVLPSDDGADFLAVVSNVNGITNSSSAILTVNADTQPPSIVSVGSFDGTKIGVCFSERVTLASATNLANYSVNSGAVSVLSATLRTNDNASVILVVSGLGSTQGTPFVVTASNIRDTSIAANSGGGSATGIMLALTPVDIGSVGVDPIVTGSAFACSSNAFEVLGGGSDIGGTADAFQFVYQQRTGNFDVAMRVARLDATDRLSKAALAAREDLSAGSRNVNLYVTPLNVSASDGSGSGTNVIEADYRATASGTTVEWPGGARQSGVPYPNAWIRLTRLGDLFTSYYGTNGVDWTQLGQLTAVYPSSLYVGSGVTAHTNAAGLSTTALLQNFAFAPAPQILSQPQSLVVTNGDSATFTVVATGIGTLGYQWRFNSTNITDATNSSYTIASAHALDAGSYDVTITSAGGITQSSVAALTVRLFDYGDAPDSYKTLRASNGARHLVLPGVYLGAAADVELDGLPGSGALGDDLDGMDDEDGVRFVNTLLAGQTATVEVVASTNGLLNAWIDWNGNGTFADPGEQVFTNRALVTGTNLLQFVVAPHATIQLSYARFRFCTVGAGTSGGNVSFDGPVSDGEVEDYAVTVTPVTDRGVAVTPSATAVAVGSNLVFTVLVTNGGPSTATSVNITNQLQGSVNYVSVAPSRGSCTRTGDTISCALGQMLEAETATVAITVVPQTTATISNYVSVSGVETDLNGANDSAGSTVVVELSPVITTQPLSQTITQGSAAAFNAAASGTAPLFYQWFKDAVAMSGQQQTNLTITNVTSNDEANYTIQVSNRVGVTLSQIARLTVLVPPSITQNPQSTTNYAGGTLSLSVGVNGTAPFQYQWMFNATNALANATNSSLLLSNIVKTQSGDYQVRVANAAGMATSQVAHVSTVEADFGDAPDSYGTTLASTGAGTFGGARHLLVPGVRLGAAIDYEGDGQPHSAALGDDLSGTSDEDGVIFSGNFYVGQTTNVAVIASTNGILNGWVDFQADGTWTDAVDHVLINVPLSAGTNLLSLSVPFDANPSNTFARFRFSTVADLTPWGEAPNGEVEDYLVTLRRASDLALLADAVPGSVPTGADITYTVRITNNGPSSAHSLALTDVLPVNTTFISATSAEAACVQDNGIVTCTLAELATGQIATVAVTAHPLAVGTYTNTTSVHADEFDPVSANNTVSATTIVQQPPSIIVQPSSQTATNGNTVTFNVSTSGTALQYQWRFNGTNLSNGPGIAGVTNPTLVLSNVQSSQSGPYTVLVSNLVGAVTSDPASLTVLNPVGIISQPQSQTVFVGEPVTFSVVASGTGPFTYLWFFNGGPLQPQTNSTLQIASAQSSDAGEYLVRVQNSAGTIMSDPAVLTVVIPPSITQQPQSRTNVAGSTALLSVQADGTAPLAYQWSFNSNTIAFATNSSLTLSNLQTSNSGFYTVLITNAGGSVTSVPALLAVFETDFGDAPDIGYPTLLAFNGARHRIVPGIQLGARIDYEPDGQPNSDATGDDLTGNDEDGILFVAPWYMGQMIQIAVIASTNGLLNAWADWNQNGSWLDVGEQIFSDQNVVTGTNLLMFQLPGSALPGATFARFRFSTVGGLSAEGEAPDGEVEDYRVNVLPAVDLRVKVYDSPDPVVLGSNLVYTITISNSGPSAATSVALIDPLPAAVTFVSALATQGSCSFSNGVVSCDLGTIPATDQETVTLTVQPNVTAMLTNSVTVISSEHDANPADNVDTQRTAVVSATPVFANPARIDVNDAGTAQVYPSTIFVSGLTATVFKVTVTLSNISHTFPDDLDILLAGPSGQTVMLMSDVGGGALLDGVSVQFDDDALLTLPDNSGFVSGIYKPANYPPLDDPLPPPAPLPPYGTHLSGFRGTDPNGIWSLFVVDDETNDVGFIADGWSLDVTTIDPMTDVGISVLDTPHEVILGSNLTYTITVTNNGPGWATDIHLQDLLPSNVDFLAVTNVGGSCSNSSGTIDCIWSQLAAGSNVSAIVTVRARELGVISNYASVTIKERDLHQANNSATTFSVSKLPADLRLSVSSSPDPVQLGGSVSYTLVVSNKGPNDATAVIISDQLPPNVQYINATSSQGSCSQNGGSVTCPIGSIAVGATATVTISASAIDISIKTNQAVVSSYEIDLQPVDNQVAQLTAVALFTAFTASQITIASNDPAVPYPSVVSVSGLTSAVYGVSVTLSNIQSASPDDLDILLVGPHGEKALLLSDVGGSNAISGVTLQLDDRAVLTLPDEQAIVSGQFRPANYVIGNEAFASPAPAGPFPASLAVFNDTNPNGPWSLFVTDRRAGHGASSIGSWTLSLQTIVPIADLRVLGQALPNPVAAGSNLTYTIIVSNAGPATASGLILSNLLSTGQTFVSATTSMGSCSNSLGAGPSGQSVVCSLSNLVAGSGITVDVTVTAGPAGSVSNAITAIAQQRDLVIGNNSLIATAVIEDAPTIVTNPTNLLRVAGETAVFNVQATGTAPLNYQWRYNSTPIPQANASQLILSNVTLSDSGSYDVQVTNRVGSTFSAAAVLNVRLRPVIDPIADQVTPEDVAKAVPIVIGDYDTPASNLVVSARAADTVLVPTNRISISGSGSNRVVNILPATNLFGATTVFVTVTDTFGISATNTFLLTVTPVNDLPVISAITNQITDEDVLKVVTFTIGDVETAAASLTLNGTSSDTNLVPNAALTFGGSVSNRTVTIRPATNQFGTTTIQLTVTDGDGGSSSRSFLLTVNSVNDLPTIDPIADQVTAEDVPKTVALRIGDVETPAPALSLQGFSTNTVLVPNQNISFSGTGSNRLVTITPATNQNGATRITLIVTDANGGSASNSFNLTVTAVNDAPTIFGPSGSGSIADVGIDEDTTAVINFIVLDTETASNLVVTASSSNTGLIANTNIVISGTASNRTATITPATNQSGSSTITLTVTDPQSASASTTFRVTVNPTDDPPSIGTIANQVIAENSSSAAIPFVVDDLETSASNLVVTARSSNQQLLPDTGIALGAGGSNRTVRLTPATNQFGAATITLTVRDPEGLAASNSFVLTVTNINDPPILAGIANQTINEDALLSVALSFGDPDTLASNLVFSATSSNLVLVPNGNISFPGSPDGSLRNLQVRPATNESGTATITVTVSDGITNARQSFVLTVIPVNDPPTLNTLTNLNINEDAGPQTVSLSGISSGAANENQTLSVTAVSSNPSLIPNPGVAYTSPNPTGSLSFTPATNANGSAIITVTVSDGQATLNRAFTVTVNPVNDGPSISTLTNQTIAEDTALAVPFVVNDLETPSFLLTVTANSSNTTLVPITNVAVHGTGTNRIATILPATNAFGTSLITLTVNDGQGSASSSFLLTVTNVNDSPTLDPLNDQNFVAPGGNGTISQAINLTGISTGASNEVQTLTITATSGTTTVFNNPTINYTSPNATGTLNLTSVRGATGSSVITVRVSDGQATNTQTFTARIRASSNTNPTISAIANTNVNEDAVAGPIPFIIGDAQTPVNSLTVTARSLNQLVVPDSGISLGGGTSSNRTVTITPRTNTSGTAIIQITVGDAAFGATTTNFVVTVNPVNDAPAISTIGPQIINEDTPTLPLAFSVSDVETPANALIVTGTSSNPTLVPTNNIVFGGGGTNRAVMIIPATNQFGTSTITVTVSDGATNASTSFLLTVNSVSDLPTIAPIPDQTTPKNTPTTPIAVTIGDGETAAASLSLSVTSSVPSLVSSFAFGGSVSNRTLVITPATNQTGTATITVTVTDTDGGTNSASFLLTVAPANDPPTLDAISDLLINQDSGPQTVNLSGITAGGNESQTLAVSAVSSNPGIIANPSVTYTSPNTTGSLVLSPVQGTNGIVLITVTVNDGQTNTTSRTFVVTVNDRPAFSSIADQVSPEDAVIGPLPFTVSDRDTSNLVVSASSSNPALIPDANILIAGTGSNRTVRLTPLTNQFGFTTITLSTTDSTNLSGSRSFVVVVTPVNDTPTMNGLSDLVINEDAGLQTVNLSGIGSGAPDEAQLLSISAVSSNPGLIPNPTVNYTSPNSTGSLSFTPAPDANGTAIITVTVNDGGTQNPTVSRSLTVTVNPVNDAPTLDPLIDLVISQNAGLQTIGLSGISAGGGETQTLAVTAACSNQGLIATPIVTYTSPNNNGYLTFAPAANQSGIAIITVTVNDGAASNNLFNQAFRVTVGTTAPPTAPTILSITRTQFGINVQFTTESNFRYTLESKTDVNGPAWNTVGSVFGNGAPMTLSDGISDATRFYHIRVD